MAFDGTVTNAVAKELAEKLGAEIVQVIGTRLVLFRRNEKSPQIEL